MSGHRILALALMLLLPSAPVARSKAEEPGSGAAKSTVRESFKFDPDEELVLIPVRLGAGEYPFVLDTGCTWSVVDVSQLSHLGSRVDTVEVATPGGTTELELYSSLDARVGSLPLKRARVGCADLASLREASGCNIRGIIGVDFLGQWIVAVDFDTGRVDILPPETAPSADWGESVSVAYTDMERRYIPATVGRELNIAFMIDTGYTGTGHLEDRLFSSLGASNAMRESGDTKTGTLAGYCSSRLGRLSCYAVGPFCHENLQFASGSDNVLGLGYLRRYRVVIDFPHKRVYLAKGKTFADHDLGHTCGLGFVFKSERIEVNYMDEKGCAYAAGVREKDTVVDLCGRPVSEWKPSEINRLLKSEGKTVQMTLERDGKLVQATFVLKEYD